jgi:peptide/nickel transport system permease protein
MLRYALRRLAWLPVILFGVSLIAFVVLRTLPGQDPASAIAGQGATQEQIDRINNELGLGDPIFPVSPTSDAPFIEFQRNSQYGKWITGVLRGDPGKTFQGEQPILELFKNKFPASFQIVMMSFLVSVVVGVSIGVLSAVYRNGFVDYFARLFAVASSSIPEFFLLALLIIIPSYLWNYSQPVGGYVPIYEDPWQNLRLFVPPALIVGVASSAGLVRLTRTTMLEVLRADYVRTAHAKGLQRHTVIISHALRNSMTPILTAIGTGFVTVFGGSIIAERVLSIDGLGFWFFSSALIRDLPVVQFLVLYTATVVVLVNLIVDLSYGWADPRVRYS